MLFRTWDVGVSCSLTVANGEAMLNKKVSELLLGFCRRCFRTVAVEKKRLLFFRMFRLILVKLCNLYCTSTVHNYSNDVSCEFDEFTVDTHLRKLRNISVHQVYSDVVQQPPLIGVWSG